ncbi:phosphatidate cytidylyltransferase [Clostridium sp. 19966]|uniref:phosphatidate cytidylyltransferase n=1 Tax=Clostridium sp. 19966 TaxID=2768166 RepID=UPI0028DF3223|nr:phosphatidate cytidylyltransferase [Clostridium sp. 19966]MDT8716427.1 phosphatidate cytidylyltransferase [Clostridium sp. 19966]
MNSRYLGAAIIAPFFIFVLLGGYFLQIFIAALSMIGIYEFYKVTKSKGYKPLEYCGYLVTALYYILLIINGNVAHLSSILVLFTFLMLCIPIINIKYNITDVSLTVLGFIYVSIFFSFIPLINMKLHGNLLVWLVFVTAWSCDTAAYYSGRHLKKILNGKKLCPKVSPNKTVVGSLGGVLGSAIITYIFGNIVNTYIYTIPALHYLIMGLLCGILGQFGDLVASSIKRYAGVKDYSNLIPGHGGILDRFDSILFTSVVIYYYLTYIVHL